MARLATKRDEKVTAKIPQKHISRVFNAANLIRVAGLVYNDRHLQNFIRYFRIDGRVVQKTFPAPESVTEEAAPASAPIAWLDPSARSRSTVCYGFADAAERRAGTHISKVSTNSAVETGLHCQAGFDAFHHITKITTRPVRTGL
jgi:hypothetical protein